MDIRQPPPDKAAIVKRVAANVAHAHRIGQVGEILVEAAWRYAKAAEAAQKEVSA